MTDDCRFLILIWTMNRLSAPHPGAPSQARSSRTTVHCSVTDQRTDRMDVVAGWHMPHGTWMRCSSSAFRASTLGRRLVAYPRFTQSPCRAAAFVDTPEKLPGKGVNFIVFSGAEEGRQCQSLLVSCTSTTECQRRSHTCRTHGSHAFPE